MKSIRRERKKEKDRRNAGRADQRREGKRQCQREERIRRQPKGNGFEAATPLICLALSATDKLGQIGEEEEKSDEKKENKEHLISPAGASVGERSAEEKLSISEAISISTLAAGSLRLFQRTQSSF